MKVKPGNKLKNLLGFATNAFKDERVVLWSGSGPAIIKAITCAEIMKRKFNNLHQITRICFRKYEEMWEPITDGLDKLVVDREIPTIHIMLSKDVLDNSQLGYQGPEMLDSSFHNKPSQVGKKKTTFRKRKPVTSETKEKFSVEDGDQQMTSGEMPQELRKRNQKRKRKSDVEQKKDERAELDKKEIQD